MTHRVQGTGAHLPPIDSQPENKKTMTPTSGTLLSPAKDTFEKATSPFIPLTGAASATSALPFTTDQIGAQGPINDGSYVPKMETRIEEHTDKNNTDPEPKASLADLQLGTQGPINDGSYVPK